MNMVDAITDQNFEEETKDGVVLTDFWATWCGPCKMQSPVVDQLAEERQDVKFTKMDVDQNQETAKDLGIMAIPTLLIKKVGMAIMPRSLAVSKEKLSQILDQYTD